MPNPVSHFDSVTPSVPQGMCGKLPCAQNTKRASPAKRWSPEQVRESFDRVKYRRIHLAGMNVGKRSPEILAFDRLLWSISPGDFECYRLWQNISDGVVSLAMLKQNLPMK